MLVPPDGGWGWVIVAASFMCNLVVDGIMFSFGTFQSHIQAEFQTSASKVALTNSLQTGFYLMAGELFTAIFLLFILQFKMYKYFSLFLFILF